MMIESNFNYHIFSIITSFLKEEYKVDYHLSSTCINALGSEKINIESIYFNLWD